MNKYYSMNSIGYLIRFKTIVLLLSINSSLFSQMLNNNFTHITEDDGLLSNHVNHILQDHLGYLWFATFNGLTRYDGYELVNFSPEITDTNSLQDPILFKLFEDSKGDIWIGAYNSISKYIRAENRFIKYDISKIDGDKTPYYAVYDFAETKSHEIIALAFLFELDSKTNCLFSIKNNSEEFEKIKVDGLDYTGPLFAIEQIDDDKYYIAGSKGLAEFQYSNSKINWLPIEDNTPISSILKDGDDTLWLGTINKGVIKYNIENKSYEKFPEFDKIENLDDSFIIYNIIYDQNNNLLIASSKGLLHFNKNNDKLTIQKIESQNPSALHSSHIMNIMQDNAGSIWLATEDAGISRYNLTNNFTAYSYIPHSNSISPGWIERIFEFNEDEIWFGGPQTKISVFNNKTHTFRKPYASLPENMLASLKDSDNNIWISSFDGIYKSNADVINFKKANVINDSVRIEVFLEDNYGRIWMGSNTGMFVLDKKNGTTAKIDFRSLGLGTSESNIIRLLIEDSEYNIWIGSDDGLFKFDTRSNQYSRIGYSSDESKSLLTQNVNALYVGNNGILWIGTWLGGLNSYNIKTGEIKSFSKRDGLKSHSVQGILGDERNGALWLSTFNGISRFDINKKTFNNFDVDDGISASQFADGGILKTSDGEFIFGSQNGVTVFIPDNIKENIVVPKIQITDLKLSNQSMVPGKNSPLKKPIYETETVSLNYDQNDLSIDFIAFHFVNPKKNQYAYYLENYDDDWRYVGNQRTAFYPNLPPGNYIFRVKASNNNDIWNDAGKSLAITILAPWYQKWWAYSMYFLAAFGFFYSIRKFELDRRGKNEKIKENQLRAETAEMQARAIQAENDRKTKELEEARKLQLSMLPKELPKLPNLDIAVYMKTATEVGGDYYDFHIGSDGELTVAVGDATGHGMKAGTMVTAAKSLFSALAENKDILKTFHEITRCIKLMRFEQLSMCMTILKINGTELQLSSAGMPPVYIFRHNHKSIEEYLVEGMPLGTFNNFPYKIENTFLKKNDVILIMSDGFPELMNSKNELLGYKNAKRLFEEKAEEDPETIISFLKDACSDWLNDREADDDITFVVIKVK